MFPWNSREYRNSLEIRKAPQYAVLFPRHGILRLELGDLYQMGLEGRNEREDSLWDGGRDRSSPPDTQTAADTTNHEIYLQRLDVYTRP